MSYRPTHFNKLAEDFILPKDEARGIDPYVFNEDIVIAIDEMPVSGMRVRDIIKILKDRAGRQRDRRTRTRHGRSPGGVERHEIVGCPFD